jgi:hypothetical protein
LADFQGIFRRIAMSPILKLKKPNEKKEKEFELNYLASLSYKERLEMMLKQSAQLLGRLLKGGYLKPFEIVKRS